MVHIDGWEFVRRNQAKDVVGIVAVTEEGELLLVEQYRPPVNCPVIELPAGLVGDVDAEDLLTAAQRELEEETGYRATHLNVLARGPSSAGLTEEVVTLVLAEGLTKVGGGGGIENERITLHRVPTTSIGKWLGECAAKGTLIDHKIHAALWWLQQVTPSGQRR
jgi:ADP-ribose pyrophosphatase